MSTFNKQHYKVIAQAIRNARSSTEPSIIPASKLINLLSFHFKLDNPRFNADSFHKACGEKPTAN
jgi:hypothetical protein